LKNFTQTIKKGETTMLFHKQKQLEDNLQSQETGQESPSHDFIIEPDFVHSRTSSSRDQKGTITVRVSVSGKEFTRFTILPDILTDASAIVRGLIYAIDEPQVEITSNCECAWCNQKVHELEEFLEK
jgi:hypothetical protein